MGIEYPKIKVWISGNYKEDQEPTFNYTNNETGESHNNLSLEEVTKLGVRDHKKGLWISHPSEIKLR